MFDFENINNVSNIVDNLDDTQFIVEAICIFVNISD